jgi:hypothetical protein
MQRHIKIVVCLLFVLLTAGTVVAAEKSADQVAKELSNPAGSLASLFTSLEYTLYKGDWPGAAVCAIMQARGVYYEA